MRSYDSGWMDPTCEGLSLIRSLTGVLLLVGGLARLSIGAECNLPNEGEKNDICKFIERKFGAGAALHLRIVSIDRIQNSCFFQLTLRSSEEQFVETKFFLSPDHRFLTTEIFDLSRRAALDERESELRLNRELSVDPAPSFGDHSAKVTVVLFADFQRGFCASQFRTLVKAIASGTLPNTRLLFRFLPLPSHEWALAAATAAACTEEIGTRYFWEVAELLFDQQSELVTAKSIREASMTYVKLHAPEKLTAFQFCLGQGVPAVVQRDVAFAKHHGIDFTPALYVNGHLLRGETDISVIRRTGADE